MSASYALSRETKEKLLEHVTRDLATQYGNDVGQILRSRVVREPWGTFCARPGTNRLRCEQVTPVPNLFLAGDWTRTELPATMEGAAKSGTFAAQAALDFFRSSTPAGRHRVDASERHRAQV